MLFLFLRVEYKFIPHQQVINIFIWQY
jgi:hypothetical protein